MKLYNFKTNITSKKKAQNLMLLLQNYFNIISAEIDFEKMKGLMKIESPELSPIKVTKVLNEFGYTCEEIN